MRTKILFGALLLSVALCSRGFSGECCAPATGLLPEARLLREGLWLREDLLPADHAGARFVLPV